MEVKLWEGGLQSQEIKAIEIIQKTFSPDPVSGKSRPKGGGSLQDQMRGLGLKGMFPWKGYAGFRFVDAKGNEGEFDLVIVTHCNVLIVELKDWNQGEVKSRGDRWYKNDVDMGRSPVSVTQKKVHLLKNKLERFKHRFSNSGWTPFVHHFVVMTGNAGFSKITDQERIHTLSLKEFLSLADEGNFNKKFVKVHSNAKVLNQDFDIFDELFLGNNTAPKQIRVDGYRATDLIFEHPKKVYKEFQAVSEISKGDEALLRLWNFENLSGSKAKTADGRFAIVSREREVLQFIKHQDHDLYKHCLRSLTSVQKDELTTEYSEVYELPPNHLRFNEFIAKHGPSFSDIDKSNLMKLLVAKFADLHQIKVAHRDLGDHSIWISPSKEVALSNFISAYHKPAGTVGDYRQFLAVNEILDGADLEGVRTPFEADVRALGLLSWHILNAKRISPKSIAEIKEEAVTSTSFYGPVLLSALTGGHFADATELFDALKDAEPKDGEILSFDQAELDPYRKTINHSRQFREDDDFLVETEEREVYLSNGLIVKAWLNVAVADDASSGHKLLHFLRRVEKLQAASPHYIPCIREFGIATKSASLYVVMDNAEGFHWNELSLEEPDKFIFIKRLIDAVEHLHGMNIAHGDLHPGNVIAGREDGEYALYLIDIPDYSADSEETFNHRYSPENIDSCTAYERDNYAVMRMACELLGIEWEESSEKYKYITDAVAEELEDTLFGFKDLARFKSAIQTPESEFAQPVNVSLKGSFEPITIYPDNGHLYVQIEPSNKDPSDARVRMLGIGGSVDLIFKVKDRAFVVGFAPRARSSVRRDDTEKSQLELDFPIRIEPSSGYDLSELSKKLESSEAFARAIELALQKEDSKEVAAVDSVLDSNEIALEAIEEFGARTEPELRISTENLWKAILETETESYPYIEVYDGPRPVKDNKDQLIIPYQADVDALGQFRKTDVIEALILDKDKEISIGEVLLKQSALNEIRLSKLRFKAKNLSEGDLIFFRTKQDRASYEKRKAALQCLLDREGLITNLVTYFDPSCALPAQTYDVDVTEEDFSRYDRTDDQGNLISLNQQQRGAFQKLIQNGPLSLLQGPPGTGKTEFIAAFVHYLIEKQQVQRVLLVSQSHEAVNTAAERIRNHCARLDTSLDVVRFSNREGAVSSGLKDVYSNSIISEKRELFRAEAKHRASSLGRALGLEPGYLSALVNVELKLFRQIDHSTSLMDSLASQKLEAEDAKELKKSLKELNETIRISMHEEFGIVLAPEDGVDVAKKRVIDKLNHDYAVRPDEALRARALAKISRDMLNVLETEEVNYDEFLARSRQLVAGTCVGIGQRHIGIRENQYDWVIIDEAARSISSELAIAMQAGKRVLLVGDHKQLPPLYTIPHKQALARRLGISASASDLDVMLQSDFARAFESKFGDQVGATLLTQYRMGPQIGDLVSEVFYDGKLGNGNRAIPDIYDPLPTALQAPVTWLDTSSLGAKANHQSDKGVSIYNRSEADLIIKLLKEVAENLDLLLDLKSSVKDGEPAIGVICMYGEQKRILRQKFKEVQWDDDFKALVKIDTVDSYQGKENRIIILSLTRSDKHQSPGFLKAPNRINVALSRAMDRLLIVGSLQMWQSKNKDLPLGRVASFMEEKGASGGYRFVNAQSGKEQGGQVQ